MMDIRFKVTGEEGTWTEGNTFTIACFRHAVLAALGGRDVVPELGDFVEDADDRQTRTCGQCREADDL